MRPWLVLMLAASGLVVGCRDHPDEARDEAPDEAPDAPIVRRPPAPVPASAPAKAARDAGVADALTADTLSGAGTSTGSFFDSFRPRPATPTTQRRGLELTLRSTPPGALAAVDGIVIGPTPTFWTGKVTGKPREFTFVLDGYALARYRFVPVQNGVVHATLKRVVRSESAARDAPPAASDAGAP